MPRNVAAANGSDAERGEKARRDERGLHLHGVAASGQVHSEVRRRERRHVLEDRRSPSHVLELAMRQLDHGRVLLDVGLPHDDEPIGVGERERRQQHGLHRRIDRRRGADGKPDGDDRRERESGSDAEASKRLTERC